MKVFTQLILAFSLILGFGFSADALGVTNDVVSYANADSLFGGQSVSVDDGLSNAEASTIVDKLKTVANVFVAIVLTISIIMIVVGAFRYITSSGNTQKAEEGKMILFYSGIGIVIALSAFALARFFAGFQI